MKCLITKKKKGLLWLLFLSLSWSLPAQEGIKPMTSVAVFQERLKKEAAQIVSIESEFTQEKYLSVFSEKVVSKGRFYYRKESLIRMNYTSPLDYEIVINGQKLKIVSEGKTNVVHLGSNQMMNEMKGMLSACMIGDLNRISPAYQLSYFEGPGVYLVKIRPVSPTVQAYIREITVTFDVKDVSVCRLRLSENADDYTEYVFTRQKYNTLSDDAMFSIR